ncbi:Glutaredoxin [Ancylostoma caninum]|uniref:Glutaredoxin n=1 Tax=Ancylostoma caninum TaxID=29170 RepID=A0A368HAL9_ANCCA|nr:Glutaredoxin [Ancylostoma caninum]
MYSKTYCPYSKKLKKLLNIYAINDLKVIELDRQKEMKGMQSILKRMTGRSTVPQLFIDGEFVGGHDETRAIEDRGELRKMLERARAL